MFVDPTVSSHKQSGFTVGAIGQRGVLAKTKGLLSALMTVTLLTACGTETDKPLDAYASPYVPPVSGVAGRVANGVTSAAIVGATVSIGSKTGTTNSTGRFLLTDIPVSTRTLVHVTASGYVDGFPVTSTAADSTSSIATQLLPINTVSSVDVATGGIAFVTGEPAARVEVAANSMVLADATPATGSVNVAVTPIDPAQNLISMPGDFTASTNEPMESFGAMAISGANTVGDSVALGAGQTATIRIPYATRNTDAPPSTLSLFYFDTTTGYWVERGTATLGGFAPDQYYQGTIDRFGIWTAAKTISPSVFLNGCVRHEGTTSPVANVRVQAEGINYSGMSTAISGADGKFRMAIKSGGTVIVNGQLGSFVTNTFSAGPATAEFTMTECLSLAALSGAPRITLTWGASPSDIDSHIFAPDGTHVFYSSKGTLAADPFIKLDVDDVTSYGPEVVTITRLMVGTYTYGVRNFSNTHSPGITGSPVRVELRLGDELTVFTPTAAMGETSTNDWWTIFRLTVDAQCKVTVTPLNVFSTGGDTGPAAPALPSAVPRQYCVAP